MGGVRGANAQDVDPPVLNLPSPEEAIDEQPAPKAAANQTCTEEPLEPGIRFGFGGNVTNSGTEESTGVEVTYTMDGVAEFVPETRNAEKGTWSTATAQQLVLNISVIAPGEVVEVTFDVQSLGEGTATYTLQGINDSGVFDQFTCDFIFGQPSPAGLSGLKWNDANGNGQFDDDEEGLSGWTIELNTGQSTTTDANGAYSFPDLEPGEYTVSEAQQDGWSQTFPSGGSHTVTLESGDFVEGLNFGNELTDPGTITGVKWNDANGNGQFDDGEEGLDGWTLILNDGEQSTTTDANGAYSFTELAPGTYTVGEVQQIGWEQTFPSGETHSVTLESGEFVEGLNFGNRQPGADVAVEKGAEPDSGTAGAEVLYTITVTNQGPDPAEGVFLTDQVFTDASEPFPIDVLWDAIEVSNDGTCSEADGSAFECDLGTVATGETVTVTVPGVPQQPGTMRNVVDVTALDPPDPNLENNSADVTTPVAAPDLGSISGTKWNDRNGNGEREEGEEGLEGWTIVLDGGEQTTTTDGSGNYTFSDLEPGVYAVAEEGLDDWLQTFPGEAQDGENDFFWANVTVEPGASVEGVDFGNVRIPVIEPPSTGNTPSDGTAGDPVSTFTGELFFSAPPDLSLGGPLPVRFQRYYASLLKRNGRVQSDLGPNWMHTFDRRLIETGATTVEVVLQRGRIVRFEKEGNAWTQATLPERPYQLLEESGGYRLANPRAQRIYTFDADGKLTKIEDGRSNQLTLTYDGSDRLSEVSDGLGRTLTFTYSGDRLASVSDGARTVTFSYADGLLTGATDALGNTTAYSYDDGHELEGLLTEKMRPGGNTVLAQTYDTEGRVESQTDALGNTTTFEYAEDEETGERTTTVNEPGGGATVHVHNADGQLLAVTDAGGQTIDLGYSDGGQRDQITDRLGDNTRFTFDPTTRLPTSVSDARGGVTRYTYTTRTDDGFDFHEMSAVDRPDGTSVTYQYDGDGNPTSVTSPGGHAQTATYTDRGQPLTVTNPEGGTTTFAYKSDATLAAVTDPSGNTTSFAYDGLRRPVTITRPDGTTRRLEYDAADRITSLTDEEGRTTAFTYDANGNLTSITDPSGQTVQRSYDAMDRLTRATDRTGQSTTYSYDARGRLETITDRTGNTSTFGYDADDRLTSIRDGAGQTWTIRYDAEGVPTALTNPGGETTTLTSNAMGWITQITSPQGHTTSRTHDPMGRVTAVQEPGGGTTQMPRDARGLLDGMTLPGGASAAYARDGLGLLEQQTGPEGGQWATPRDAQGRVANQSDPLGRTATHTHDARSRVAQVEQPEGLGTVTLTYDGTSRLTGLAHSSGPSLSYEYDADGRLTSAPGVSLSRDAEGRITESNGLGATRDADGRLASVTLPGGTVQYRYDGAGRLTEVEDWQGGVTAFRYDETGRLAEVTRPNGVATTYNYDGDGQVVGIEETNGDGMILAASTLTRDARGLVTQAERTAPVVPEFAPVPERLAYDAAGQIEAFNYDALGRVTNDGTRTYTWDGLSRLTSFSDSSGATQFTYDAFGHRLSHTSGGTTQSYVWNYALGLPSVAVEKEGGSDRRYYVHAPDGALLYSVDATGGERRFYHYDETGNTRLLTGEDGTVHAAYAYTPYGRIAAQQGDAENPFTWQGQFGVMGDGNGLYYARARCYDAQARRFLTPDPITSAHPAEITPYQYARANPQRFVDPTGRAPVDSETLQLAEGIFETVFSDSFGITSLVIKSFSSADDVSPGAAQAGTRTAKAVGAAGNLLSGGVETAQSGSLGRGAAVTGFGFIPGTTELGLGADALDVIGQVAGRADLSNFKNFLLLPARLVGAFAEDLATGSSFSDDLLTETGQIGDNLPFFEFGRNIGDALGLPELIQPDVVGEMINTTTLQANDGSRSTRSGNTVSLNPVQQGTDAESEECVPSGGIPFEVSFGPLRTIIVPTTREAPRDKRPSIMTDMPLKLVIC